MTDKDYYQLTISISKALSGIEIPLKVKHARAAIIGTFHTQGAHSFWAITLRQPLQENRITAWKFCHLLHKVLREGHPLCCQHSMRHRGMITEMGKLWGHLNDGYGLAIKHYTKLLVSKLEFHDRNPRFPGHLSLKRGELEMITGNDINSYFELAVEMFDYLEDILALQAAIFQSITMFHVNSMTSAGQCRLAPLIPLIQDSNPLYDFLVRIMFKLHGHLPNDVLIGHRDRFRGIFTQLKSFYNQSRNLQYFVNLITVPKLPENVPNFTSQVEFGSYTAPVVVIPEPDPEPEPEPIVDNLVDMSPSMGNHSSVQTPVTRSPQMEQRNERTERKPQIDYEKLIHDRDDLIFHLQTEVDRLGKCLKMSTHEHREEKNQYDEKLAILSSQLSDKDEELVNMRFMKEDFELRAQTAERAQVEEEKIKMYEEKFTKLKLMYTQIREEHVKLLREHGDLKKQLSQMAKSTNELVVEKEAAINELEKIKLINTRTEEQLQKSTNGIQSERTELSAKVQTLENENSVLSAKFNDLEARHLAQTDDVTKMKNNLDNQMMIENERNALATQCSASNIQIESLKCEINEQLKLQDVQKEEFNTILKGKQDEIISLLNNIDAVKAQCEQLSSHSNRLQLDKDTIETDFQDLLHEQEETKEKLINASNEIETLQSNLIDIKIREESRLRALIEACIKSSEKLVIRAVSENDVASATGTSVYFSMVAEELQIVLNQLAIVHDGYMTDPNSVEGFARKVILGGHLMALIHVQGIIICNTCPDIELGENITQEIKNWTKTVQNLFASLCTATESGAVKERIGDVKLKLDEITTMIHDLSKKTKDTDAIADIIESELAGMDKAIEEAASSIEKMLSKSRQSDSGIKLEVNEKILDACTMLMNNIRILVQKSRNLQAEIVSLGKGTASAKEFYKRNHQWTEGLISAAKSVAQGANFLVTAANKAVSEDSQHQLDLIVAAQEIAACTAQLVVSSRVKAPRNSSNLHALGEASRNVTQSTGAVVATVKDCSQRLEDSQDMDLTNLTVHQAKTLEMEIQVNCLELEQALQMARSKLAAFRRKNYREN